MADPKPALVPAPEKTLASFLNDWAGKGLRTLKGNVEISSSGIITLSVSPHGDPGNSFVCTVRDNTLAPV